MARSAQNFSRVRSPLGSDRFEAKPSDLRHIPLGMWDNQLSMGRPKMRNGMPWPRRWAARESPYGPAPTIAISVMRVNRSFKRGPTDTRGRPDTTDKHVGCRILDTNYFRISVLY